MAYTAPAYEGATNGQYEQAQFTPQYNNNPPPNMAGQNPQQNTGGQPFQYFEGQDLVAGAAVKFGTEKLDEFGKNVAGYVNTGQLRSYFKVDTKYVAKKLGLLLFPFTHKDWTRESGTTPRDNVNTPDLYIPTMSFVTYILVVGIALGTQNRFTPERLGLSASSAMAWVAAETFFLYAGTYLLGISGTTIWEIMSLVSYKYVGMILAMLGYIVTQSSTTYYGIIGWCALTLAFFLFRSMMASGPSQTKKIYLVGTTVAFQVLLMYWRSSKFIDMPVSAAAEPVPESDDIYGEI